MIYVPDGEPPEQTTTGIFVSDERNADNPRVIVAQQYEVIMDASADQVALRLQHGVIHSRPKQTDQYDYVSFASYDLKLPLDQTGYSTPDERLSYDAIIAQLAQSQWRDPAALRRLMEYYKDLAFPTASLVFCLLGIPVGIASKRSGRIGGFAVGVLVIIVYYMLNIACEFLVMTARLPPLAGAWMPNGMFLFITVVWFYIMSRR
jgi:lipopolysaccharide export system permease protein